MRISRIPAEAGKALEPRRDGKTAHNLQQPRYLAIISRRLAPLNEKWGKSRLLSRSLEGGSLSRFPARPPSARGKKYSQASRKVSRTLAARFRLRKVRVLRPVNTERAKTRQHRLGAQDVRTGPASERAQRPNGPGARRTCAAPGAWRPNGPGARSTRAAPGAWRPNGPGAGRPNGPGARSTCAAPGAWRPNGPGARRTRAKGAPKGGTRARASGLRLFRPRQRMPSPRLHPLCARLPLRARLSF